MSSCEHRWLLLIHHGPRKPDYARVKVWRRLQCLGAVAIKNGVHVLPSSDQTREDFQWVQKEVARGGGEAAICEVRFIDGLTDEQVEAMFNEGRDREYAALAEDLRALSDALPSDALTDEQRGETNVHVRRLKKRFHQIVALDFFRAPGRGGVEGLLSALEGKLQARPPAEQAECGPLVANVYRGRTWVTRRGVHVDRIASAWLIRRFIDAGAQFRFVADRGYKPKANDVRFDMFEAEFTHEGDLCTFEVLIERFGLEERALTAIAEVVHDIDLKDGKFRRDESAGVAAAVAGIAMGTRDDDERLAQGAVLFTGLFSYFKAQRRP